MKSVTTKLPLIPRFQMKHGILIYLGHLGAEEVLDLLLIGAGAAEFFLNAVVGDPSSETARGLRGVLRGHALGIGIEAHAVLLHGAALDAGIALDRVRALQVVQRGGPSVVKMGDRIEL